MALQLNPWRILSKKQSLTRKFVLNYKKVWPEEAIDLASKPPSPPRRSYLHDHRVKDALDEYRERVDE